MKKRINRSPKKVLPLSRARYVSSKIGKTKAVESVESLRKYVPSTMRMTKTSLEHMLNKYKMVYIKPNIGMCGNGVIRIELAGDDADLAYSYQSGVTRKRFKSFDDMFTSLHKLTRKRHYLVQKGIHLLTHKGNRFDLRVMVQQTPARTWETTGVIGRVAHPTKIVTNFHNGGTLKSVDTLLMRYLAPTERNKYVKQLHVMGVMVAKAINARYRGVKEVGVDIAVDKELNPWILEVNTSPDPYIFRRLTDKRIYAKIRRYAKAYGRL
ncbi:YheC/YheD family protein [Paenibacillus qinlingensis]|uniref:Glutathione synthase/RimK-type ligase-like ATP-grasp enzyme n=1 Tax=Paenibacillus qinlingensis TaxID=1837343 RepID=A0ABU1P357_9BACL|nr:YheC/YheD family protein [Paenibacillus qinlingensis]MDR6554173.1 glutathione synthase/RimK-type ligase-like ATP-grasp enzyme [Paenibacillus qinlingensis]